MVRNPLCFSVLYLHLTVLQGTSQPILDNPPLHDPWWLGGGVWLTDVDMYNAFHVTDFNLFSSVTPVSGILRGQQQKGELWKIRSADLIPSPGSMDTANGCKQALIVMFRVILPPPPTLFF